MSLVNMSFGCIKKESLYILMALFVIFTNLFLASGHIERNVKLSSGEAINLMSAEEIPAREERIKEVLEENKFLAVVVASVSFLFAIALILGLMISVKCLSAKLNGRSFMAAYGHIPDIRWNVAGVLKTLIVFLFLGYILQFAEIFIAAILKLKQPDEKLLTVVYATLMDVLGIVVIFYFVVKKFKEKFSSLGLSLKNSFRNIRIGATAYLALLPFLAITAIAVLTVLRMIGYEQPKSPILEIFYEDSRPKILLVLTILVTVLGPIAEELFFRALAYPAIRKRLGIKSAMILVSAAFAMLHANILALLPIFILGILLAYLYEKTGSLIPSITVHIIHNSALVLSVYVYKMVSACAGF